MSEDCYNSINHLAYNYWNLQTDINPSITVTYIFFLNFCINDQYLKSSYF